jgi:hypothetical protein
MKATTLVCCSTQHRGKFSWKKARLVIHSLFGWLMADDRCWFVLREEYWWLVAGGWFVVREKYCWLVADKPNEQGVSLMECRNVHQGKARV